MPENTPTTTSTTTKTHSQPADLIACVEAYASAGYATFPTSGEKEPIKGCFWTQSPVDTRPNRLKYPCGQFGVKLKADDLIIDVDPRNMQGRKVWTELINKVPALRGVEKSATIVRTGSGGLHVYLRKPPDMRIRKKLPDFPGIDFLSAGCYVIGAGSQIEDRKYTFLSAPFSTVFAPPELLALIQRQVVDVGEYNHKGFSDSPENIERYTQYLRNLAPIAIEGQHGDETTYKIACQGRDYNLSSQKTLELMNALYNPKCKPMWTIQELQRKVANAYIYGALPPGTKDPAAVLPNLNADDDPNKWMKELEYTQNRSLKLTLRNAVLLLKHELGVKGVFIYDEFNERLEVKGNIPWAKARINRYNAIDDREIECIRLHLAQTHRVEFSTQTMWKAVDLVAAGNRYHPIKEVIEQYKWDGIPRIDTWLPTYCGAKDCELNRQIGRKVLCAMIARVYSPGCKYDYVLVLEGAQGIGKSTACAILGGEWYGDAPIDPKDKDCIPYIHSKWVIELSEMITMRKTEADRMKNFISRCEDDVRLPYARARQRFPRQCVFIGTINPDDIGYLNDTTGNRRFWPVFCERVDMDKLKRDRDQLIAEALVAYKKGEPLTMSKRLLDISERESMTRLAEDPWQWIIEEWTAANQETDEVTSQHVYQNILGGHLPSMHTGHLRRIAFALKNLGWVKRRTQKGMVFNRMLKNGDEVPF